MKYVGRKEKNKTYEVRKAIYVLIFNDNNEIVVLNVKNFGYILPCENKDLPKDEIFKKISEEIGHELRDIKLQDKIGAYYHIKVDSEIIYCDVKADVYVAKVYESGNDETIDGHEIIWKKPEAIYEKMALDFQRDILETIIRQGVS